MRPKIICVALLLAFLLTGVENASSQVQIGVRARMNFAGLRLVNEVGERQETGMIPRFQVGMTVEIPIAADFRSNRQHFTLARVSSRMEDVWPNRIENSELQLPISRFR